MTPARFTSVMILALAGEFAIFLYAHRDLVYVHRPVDRIVADRDERLDTYGEAALARPKLTRRHLETVAQAASRLGRRDLHLRALERLAREYPDDDQVQLRLGDSLRLAGRFAEAEAVYRRVLDRHAAANGGVRR